MNINEYMDWESLFEERMDEVSQCFSKLLNHLNVHRTLELVDMFYK